MADRSVSVNVTANVSGFVSSMQTAQRATQQFASRSQQYAREHGAAMGDIGAKAALMGAGILAGIGVAVKAWGDFSDRMGQVQVATNATAAEMDQLSQAALSMGTAFGMSANEVADAQIELGKAGLSAGEMLSGGLAGALGLAAAGQINVSEATEIATSALSQFNLKGKDVPHIADLLAAGANKALGGVDELGQALKQGGLVASSFGVSLDETVGTLAAFAQQGLLGSDAGTSMKTMLIALANPSKEAANKMKELGIQAYDANGQFVGMAGLADQLQRGMKDLTQEQRNQALATIFGTDAIRSANILFKEGADGIKQWTKDVNDSGYASEAAMKNLDSLNGDFKKLQATVQTGLIQLGSEADGFLRPIVQNITDAIRAFNDLEDPVKGAGLAMAGAAGGALLLGGGFLSMAPRVFDTIAGFRELTRTAPRVAGNLNAIGRAGVGIGIAAVALAAVANAVTEKSVRSATDFAEALTRAAEAGSKAGSLDTEFGNWDKMFGQDTVHNVNSLSEAVQKLANPPDTRFMSDFEKFGQSIGEWAGFAKSDVAQVQERFKGLGETMGALVTTGATEKAAAGFKVLSDEFERNGKSAQDALNTVPGYRDALKDLASQAGVTLEPQELLELAMGRIPAKLQAARDATEEVTRTQEYAKAATEAQEEAMADLGLTIEGVVSNLDKFADGLVRAGLSQLSTRDAARNYEEALDSVDESIKKNTATLDISTEAGRANQAALDGVASSGLSVVQSMAKQIDSNGNAVHSQGDLQNALQRTYDDLIKNAEKFGITGDAADDLARAALGIPKGVPIEASVQNYVDTMTKLHAVQQGADNLVNKRVPIIVDISVNNAGALDPAQYGSAAVRTAINRGPAAYATGGLVNGVNYLASGGYPLVMRPRGSDTVPAMLTPGEVVMRKDAAQNLGYDKLLYANATGNWPGGGGGNVNVAAPEVKVFIGNEQLDARMYQVASSAVDESWRDASMRRA